MHYTTGKGTLACSYDRTNGCMTAKGGQHIGRRTGGFDEFNLGGLRAIWRCTGCGTSCTESQQEEVAAALQAANSSEAADIAVAQNALQP